MDETEKSFLARLSPETLTAIENDLVGEVFQDRDNAVAALNTQALCRAYGGKGIKCFIAPREDTRKGWKLVSVEEPPQEPEKLTVAGTKTGRISGKSPTHHEAKKESQAPDSADRDDPLV